MLQINISAFIPKALRQKAVDVTVDFVVDLGKGYLKDEVVRKIKRLRSDGAFQIAFEDGLQRAADRFIEEYIDEDEDLVEAIAKDESFFENKELLKAIEDYKDILANDQRILNIIKGERLLIFLIEITSIKNEVWQFHL